MNATAPSTSIDIKSQSIRRNLHTLVLLSTVILLIGAILTRQVIAADRNTLPHNLQIVLDNTQPVHCPERLSLPLFVLPISNSLTGVSDEAAEVALTQLTARRIAYTVDWQPQNFATSLAEGLRIARIQRKLGEQVAVNANACLYSFHDGSDPTLHVGGDGRPFADDSFAPPLGCPFALEHRIPVIRDRLERFLQGYKAAGIEIDFIFADWEIDGPIEWNESWSASRRCSRCCENIANIDDFREFQRQLRAIRSRLQRIAFGDNVTAYFPKPWSVTTECIRMAAIVTGTTISNRK